jgi:hypothetical protein
MALIDLDSLTKLQKQHNAVFWKCYDPNGKTVINEVKTDIGIDASADILTDFLSSCLGDFVIVKLYRERPEYQTTGKATDQGLTLKVKLPGGTGYIGKPNTNNTGAPSFNDFLALMEAKRAVEMEKLRLELETSRNSLTDRILTAVTENPAIMTGVINLLQSFAPKRQAPAAAISATTDGANINNTLHRLSQVDPDYINTLENLTAYLEQNPGVIDQIKPIFTPK